MNIYFTHHLFNTFETHSTQWIWWPISIHFLHFCSNIWKKLFLYLSKALLCWLIATVHSIFEQECCATMLKESVNSIRKCYKSVHFILCVTLNCKFSRLVVICHWNATMKYIFMQEITCFRFECKLIIGCCMSSFKLHYHFNAPSFVDFEWLLLIVVAFVAMPLARIPPYQRILAYCLLNALFFLRMNSTNAKW